MLKRRHRARARAAMAAGQSPGASGGDAAIFCVCPDGSDAGAAPAPPSGPSRPVRPRTGWWTPSRRCCSSVGNSAAERLLPLNRESGGRGRRALLRVPRRGGSTPGPSLPGAGARRGCAAAENGLEPRDRLHKAYRAGPGASLLFSCSCAHSSSTVNSHR